jgi:hypothetical protein
MDFLLQGMYFITVAFYAIAIIVTFLDKSYPFSKKYKKFIVKLFIIMWIPIVNFFYILYMTYHCEFDKVQKR